ncbi:glycosyltransferase [Plasticicumulans acidivorans]|uniref:Rhamnosyltransferase n=1 Tax=Plasticicumulans acidivorans TaxID=886464 RepID=A0A317N128_9GAMM|nr:glycosyltransferase family 2 protein [Plasticicumulans acidivorans]PWV65628.1 rhamnosyltransferase [Plasticicumulans acidivorans]
MTAKFFPGALIVPTLNPGSVWEQWLEAYREQTCLPEMGCLVIDSGSTDDTVRLARAAGCKIYEINKVDFNHGGTRQFGVNFLNNLEFVVFCTQDALFSHRESIEHLMHCFCDEKVGAAYGRQLPHKDSGLIGAHARLFNYPASSCVKSKADINKFGIKTAFISNSFAAYRTSALQQVGGFPSNTIMNEDTYVAAKMILSDWKVAYCAEACVFHSHDYGFFEDFKRYFDIGVFHSREPWLQDQFGGAEGEGARFVSSELKMLSRQAPWLIPSACIRTFLKFAGYKLGRSEKKLSPAVKKKLSMHHRYWLQK